MRGKDNDDDDREEVKYSPKMMVMREKTDLTMFVIQKWELVYIEEDNHNMGIKMEIVLKRKLTNEIMTTFLPTVLLIFITFITMFFHEFYFEAIVTVNLTVMLVMTTIFTATMDKLPSTAYIKMVDLWLLFGQVGEKG